MKNNILLLSIAFSINAFSQPILQSSNLHTGINLFVYSLSNVNVADATPAGANLTWDLSAATIASPLAEFDFVDMASTGYAAQYPTANFALKFVVGGVTKYNLSNLTANVLEDVAINVGTSGLQTFIDNRTTLPFPFTYNLKTTDTYQKNGQSATSVTHNYDAYGTLKVGNMTFDNLVRDMSTDNGTGSTQVVWWNSSPIYPVLQVDKSGITFYKLATSAAILPINQQVALKLFPNPTNGKFSIEGMDVNLPINVEVFDMLGKNVYLKNNFDLQTSNQIDLTNFQKGIYVVKIQGGEKLYNMKIVIQ